MPVRGGGRCVFSFGLMLKHPESDRFDCGECGCEVYECRVCDVKSTVLHATRCRVGHVSSATRVGVMCAFFRVD